jgi:hypothetical protein
MGIEEVAFRGRSATQAPFTSLDGMMPKQRVERTLTFLACPSTLTALPFSDIWSRGPAAEFPKYARQPNTHTVAGVQRLRSPHVTVGPMDNIGVDLAQLRLLPE